MGAALRLLNLDETSFETCFSAVRNRTKYDYSFDPAGRLTQVKKDGSVSSTYNYDSNSNRMSQTTTSGTITSTVDNQDKLTQMGAFKYTYDQNGQLISKTDTSNGKTTQYGYNGLGQLTTVTMPDGSRIQYILDGQGLRLGKKVNGVFTERYLYDDLGRIVASFDSNNHPKNIYFYHTNNRVPDAFFRLDGSPSNTDDLQLGHAHHIILDHLGSPKLVVDMVDNSVAEEISYDEFGNVTMDTNPGLQPFGFAGGLYDRDIKFVHFGAREYDPSVGRWTARDPIGFRGGDTNLYGYVLNDPMNFKDTDGLLRSSLIDNGGSGNFGGSGSGGGGGGGQGALLIAIGAAAVGGSYVTSCQAPPVKQAMDFLKNAPDFVFDPQDPNGVLPEEVRNFERQ